MLLMRLISPTIITQMNRLEKKNQQIVGKVLRRGQVTLTIEEQYYKDVPKEERDQYTEYFKKIWTLPLLHNERSTNVIQAFWKEIVRRSYLANKSGACGKYVHQYGEHYRQKFSLYYPKEKPATPQSIVVFVHGGYFINGSEEAFEYLGKGFVEKGYLLVTMGFRQLPQNRWPDPYVDCHTGFQELVKIADQYGGNPNSIIYLTWSGGGLVVLSNFFRHTEEYEKRVKLFIAVGSPWEVSIHEKKVASVFVDNPEQLLEVLPYGYMGRKMSIPINLITGTKDKEFPQIYDHNQKYYQVYKENGLNVTLNEVENHDHYDLILDVDVALTKIREFEIRTIDPNNQISSLLFLESPEFKEKVFNILKDPIWKVDRSIPIEQDRLIAIDRFRSMNNIIGRDDHINYKKMFSLFQLFGSVDAQSSTKTFTHSSSVATVTFMGTQKHQYLLDLVIKGKAVFAFALTEAGGGNNLSESGTKATYDEKTKEIVLHNETHFSKKFWCANLAMHANYAVVFAKLIVKGKNEGTHAFVIKIRDENHKTLPGILLEDLGHKIGLNGIDNGTIMFNNHRVSKDAFLDKISSIDDDGNYHCATKSINQRFFKAIDRLLSGRLFVASILTGVIKNLCLIGVTFSRYRYGLSETGHTQIPIGNYQLQRNFIVPVVSKSLALLFFHHYCKEFFLNNYKDVELSNYCNVDKIFMTEFATEAALAVRERCGGQGMFSVNNIGDYLCISIASSTGEGDNKVLVMKIAKDALKLVGSKQLSVPISNISKITSLEQLKDLAVLLGLFQKRQAATFRDLTTKLITLKKQRKEPFEVAMKLTWEEMSAYTYAYGNRLILDGAVKVLTRLKDPENVHELKTHFAIFALGYILDNLGFYAYEGLIPKEIAREITELRSKLIRDAVKKAEILVHKLNLPEHAIFTPIAKPTYFEHFKNLKVNTTVPPHL